MPQFYSAKIKLFYNSEQESVIVEYMWFEFVLNLILHFGY